MNVQAPNSQNTPNPGSILNPGKENGRLIEMPAVDPASAKVIIDSRPMPNVMTLPAPSAIKALAAGAASNIVAGQSSIVELARALKNDPQLIFEWVYNNVDFSPTYGLQKPANMVAVDGYGNSFDQSALLIALLRQAGFTASYVLGTLQLTLAQCQAWLGTDANIFVANSIFANGGVPTAVVGTFPNQKLEISHCWVQVVVSGSTKVMDPSFKTYTEIAGMNLATATGYSQSTFLTQATTGATIDGSGNWVQNINAANINSQMQTLATNLVSYIKTNNPGATTDEVTGGRQIVPIYAPFTYLTALPYQKPGDVPTIWTTDIPTNYKITVTIDGSGIGLNASGSPLTFTNDQLYGKRMTLFYNSTNQPVLTLDGTVIATGTAQFFGSWNSLGINVTHNAYTSTNNNQFFWQRVNSKFASSGSSEWYYNLSFSFGRMGTGMIDYHSQLSQANDFAGGGDLSEPILGERLAVSWATYAAELGLIGDLIGRLTKTVFVNHHLVGMTGYFVSPTFNNNFFDLQGSRGGVSTVDGANSANYIYAAGMTWGVLGYSLEDLALRQYGGTSAASATKVLHAANAAGIKIYKGTQANWAATVVPALSGYDSNDLNNIATYYLPYGWSAFLAQTASQAMTTGTATGWSLVSQYGGASGIINYFKGGTGDQNTPPKKEPPKDEDEDDCEHADPVNMRTGDYKYRHEDLTVGSGEFPYQLGFQTKYDSRSRFVNGTLGLGWSHNWDYKAAKGSDGFAGLGQPSAIGAAASISAIYVMVDLLTDNTLPVQRVVSVHEAAYWWIGQMNGNVVTLTTPNGARKFMLMPNGTYEPLTQYADSLALVSGAYKVTSPQGEVFNFNTSGQLTSWVFPSGVTITLTYTSGNLTSISNGMGRTLTLTYTSGKLTSVSDGNGRSVGYSFDASNQLTQFTDALSQAYTFSYSAPGRMWKYFRPANPLDACVVNTYDTVGRIQSQVDILGHSYQFYLAGNRSEILDPLGNKEITYYDQNNNPIKVIDALGNATTYLMDGKQRIKRATMPEGNYEDFTFDAKNNILSRTKVAKSGSGLANIVKNFTYDPLWNKVKTSQDGRGNTTTFTYDPVTGNLTKIERPLVGGLTPTVLLQYNGRGQITQRTDETGLVTQNTYDVTTEKLLSSVIDPGTTPHLAITTNFGYNAWGDVNSVQDPRGNTTTFTFDNLRRMTLRTDPAPFSYQTQFGYDANSNMTSVQRQTNIVATPWQTYTWTFSKSDKKKTLTDPASKVWTWDYDGADRLWKETDPETRVTEYLYDSRSKLFQVKDSSLTIAETRLYTANGKVASVKDAKNNLTQYSFDGHDRLDKTTFPDTTFEQNQSYDANGNVLTYRVRSGNTIVMTYDALNRPITKTPTGQPVITYVFDLVGRLLEANTPVIAGDPSSGSHKWAYDSAKRFFREEYPDAKQVTFQLDQNGNVTKLTYADGYFVDRAYDQLNRLSTIKLNGAATAAATFGYDALSRRSSLTFNNGTSQSYTYQLNDDLTTLASSFVGASVTHTYGFNNAHEITSQQMSDSAYMWHPSPAGTVTYQATNNLNQYPKVGTPVYSYNTNGCLTGNGTWTYGYDTENHLTSASKSGTSVAYLYDPFHRQTQKAVTTTSTTKTRYIYSGWQRLADYNGTTGALQNRYVYGTSLDEMLIQVTSAGVLTFFHRNHQGTPIARTSNAGAVSNQYKIGSFGETSSLTNTTFGYNGQRYDSETGLYYYKRRYYNPTIGRFLQPDPIGYDLKVDGSCGCVCVTACEGTEASQLNLYTYVRNTPLNLNDPFGLSPMDGTMGNLSQGVKGSNIVLSVGITIAIHVWWRMFMLNTCLNVAAYDFIRQKEEIKKRCKKGNMSQADADKAIADAAEKYLQDVQNCYSKAGLPTP